MCWIIRAKWAPRERERARAALSGRGGIIAIYLQPRRWVFDGVAVDVNSLFCKQTQLALARSRYTPRGVHFNI